MNEKGKKKGAKKEKKREQKRRKKRKKAKKRQKKRIFPGHRPSDLGSAISWDSNQRRSGSRIDRSTTAGNSPTHQELTWNDLIFQVDQNKGFKRLFVASIFAAIQLTPCHINACSVPLVPCQFFSRTN